jgi:hypothetical protein
VGLEPAASYGLSIRSSPDQDLRTRRSRTPSAGHVDCFSRDDDAHRGARSRYGVDGEPAVQLVELAAPGAEPSLERLAGQPVVVVADGEPKAVARHCEGEGDRTGPLVLFHLIEHVVDHPLNGLTGEAGDVLFRQRPHLPSIPVRDDQFARPSSKFRANAVRASSRSSLRGMPSSSTSNGSAGLLHIVVGVS